MITININKLTINGTIDPEVLNTFYSFLEKRGMEIKFGEPHSSVGNSSSLKLKDGVYILTACSIMNDKPMTPEEYVKSTNRRPTGIYVCENGRSLVVALKGSEAIKLTEDFKDSVTGSICKGIQQGYADFNGKQHTNAFLKAGSPAAQFCDNYSSGAGIERDWWLPSLGEMAMIYRNKSAINNCLRICGGEEIPGDCHWTSTEASSCATWIIGEDYGDTCNNFRDATYRVRPVSSHFDFDPISL